MGRLWKLVLALAFSAVLAAPAGADPARGGIELASAKFIKAFNSGDGTGVAALYTENAALFPPGAARVDGRADIQAFWQGAIDSGLSDLTLKTIEVEANGATAYEVGVLTLKAPGENGAVATVLGKYIVVWKNGADGSWRLHRDIWNITPAAPAQ